MTTRNATVIGVFANRENAQAAMNELRQNGFREDQIGLVSRVRDDSTATTGYTAQGEHVRETTGVGDTTGSRWEEGAGIGAAAGAVTGTGLGLAVAAGLMPGIGPIIAGGTLMAMIASAGAGAAVGTVLGALAGLGVPEEEARYYEGEFTTGRTLVTVRADDRADLAWEILARHGAYNKQFQAAVTDVPVTPY